MSERVQRREGRDDDHEDDPSRGAPDATSAPYRILRPKKTAVAADGANADFFKQYLDRLMKMIPGEVVGLYLVGSGFVPQDQPVALIGWSVLCLVAVIALRLYGTTNLARDQRPDIAHTIISCCAFTIWVYTLGGPFKQPYDLHRPWIGSLSVLAFMFFAPLLYKGPEK